VIPPGGTNVSRGEQRWAKQTYLTPDDVQTQRGVFGPRTGQAWRICGICGRFGVAPWLAGPGLAGRTSWSALPAFPTMGERWLRDTLQGGIG
jgi:hypothetical protein